MNKIRAGAVLPLLAFSLLAFPALSQAENCGSLKGRTFGAAKLTRAEPVAASAKGTRVEGGDEPTRAQVAYCRVEGVIRPVPDSAIAFEVWLPLAAAWNGRYQGVGNGGFAGSLDYASMRVAVEGGFAVSATDAGHKGAIDDSSWALGHPEKIVDLGWRAVHETAMASKQVIAAFYRRKPVHSYFTGCSTGGRQGLVEAQRFPEDYDGIVAGAPAMAWPRLLGMGAVLYKRLETVPGSWVSPEKFAVVNRASQMACGGANGVLDDPGSCNFRPSQLRCKESPGPECLTDAEIGTLDLLYDGIRDAQGHALYPGYSPGNEAMWSISKVGPKDDKGRSAASYLFAPGMFGTMVRQDPSWPVSNFDLAVDLPLAEDGPVGKAMSAQSPDLSAFARRGGKLLHYHGWNDPSIAAGISIDYAKEVAKAMGGTETANSFYRLFLGPGMGHCGGGPGPNAIGGVNGVPVSRDADHDVVSAIMRWVENSEAPRQLIATRYRDLDPSKGVDSQRPWCAYPTVAKYDGRGNRKLAASYSCAAAD